jgi:hypothetical protein
VSNGNRSAAIVTLAVLISSTGHAGAEPRHSSAEAAATALFEKGRALVKQKRYAEACMAFEQSQKLDEQFGTEYNLAGCDVHIGKLASAWAAYRDLAQRDSNTARRADSDRQARALEGRLPKLVIEANQPPSGLVVTLDGADVTGVLGTELPIDLGRHQIVANAPSYREATQVAHVVDEARTVTVTIALEAIPAAAADTPVGITTHPGNEAAEIQRDTGSPGNGRRTAGIVIAASGVALAAAGLVFGKLASDKWSAAKATCGSDLICGPSEDLAAGNRLVADARTRADVATVLVIGGGVALGTGIVLWLTASRGEPTSRVQITPGAGSNALGLTVEGWF